MTIHTKPAVQHYADASGSVTTFDTTQEAGRAGMRHLLDTLAGPSRPVRKPDTRSMDEILAEIDGAPRQFALRCGRSS